MNFFKNYLNNSNFKKISLLCGIIVFSTLISPPIMAQETSLKVNIRPVEAVQDGAMWRYKEKNLTTATWSMWWQSGQAPELFASTFLVEFRDTNTNDWITPSTRTVTVNTNEQKVIFTTYQSASTESSIKVTLNPPNIRDKARWSVYYKIFNQKNYIAESLESGETFSFTPFSNPYYIEYSFVNDQARPATEAVQLPHGNQHEVTREYKDLVVGNVHIFGNKLQHGPSGFKTWGITRWAFRYSSGTESVKYVKCKANLAGEFNPPIIRGTGTLHANEDLGILDKMFSAFQDKRFYNGRFVIDANTLEAIETGNQKPIYDYIGLEWTVTDFKMIKNPVFGLNQSGFGYLEAPVFSKPSKIILNEFKVFEQDEAPVIQGNVFWEGAEIKDLLVIHPVDAYIDTASKTFTAEGFDVEVLQSMPSFRGEFKLKNGTVRKLSAELYGIGKQINDSPIIFDTCGFSFENPEDHSIKASITAGVKFVVPGTEIEAGKESWEGHFDSNGYFKVSGTREIFGYDVGDTETEIQWKGKNQYLQTSLDALFYVGGYLQFIIEGQGYLWLQWKPSFNFNGWISASGFIPLPDWLSWLTKSGQINLPAFLVKVNSYGMLISVNLFNLYTFNINIPAFWDLNRENSRSMDGEKRNLTAFTSSKTLSEGPVSEFVVHPGDQGFILSLQGTNRVPDCILVMPDGTEIDPKTHQSGNRIIAVVDEVHRVAGFKVNNPQSGSWQVKVSNPSGVKQRLVRANRSPRILADNLEFLPDGSYKLTYQAFDPDNQAVITFLNCPDNRSFQGQVIGTAVERAGQGSFTWTPEVGTVPHRYICAQIDDGINPPSHAYFEGVLRNPNAPTAPIFTAAGMEGDKLVLHFDDVEFEGIDTLKVYYSDDLEAKNLVNHIAVPPGKRVEVNDTAMPAGRHYQIRVTTFSSEGGESDFSEKIEVDYRLTNANNYPWIVSDPTKIANTRETYEYQLKVQDYDGHPITYSLIKGPEQLSMSSQGYITARFYDTDLGSKSVVVEVIDSNGGRDVQKFRISVLPRYSDLPAQLEPVSEGRDGENTLFLKIINAAGNLKSNKIDTFPTVVIDSLTGIEKVVILRETSVDSGEFQGVIPGKQYLRPSVRTPKGRYLFRWADRTGRTRFTKISY